MSGKASQSNWTVEDWKTAYEDMVRKATKFTRYETKKSTESVFERLLEKYPEVNPYLFIMANSPEYRDWWVKTKTGFSKRKYPFPNQLSGDKALRHYKQFVRQGITTVVPRKQAIINSVKSSMFILKKCRIALNDYDSIWDMYVINEVSPYLIVMLPGINKWISSKMRKNEISIEEKKVLDSVEKVLYSYHGLNIELNEILKGT
jgi:hypothetical protein